MALPTTMQLGTRIIWWAPTPPFSSPTPGPASQSVPPIDGRVLPIPQSIVGGPPPYAGMIGAGPFVGLCSTPGGAAPDFIGSAAVVFDARGQSFLVQLGVNTSTWVSGGSLPGIAHWQFVDLTA
jgi:hypothetical protein